MRKSRLLYGDRPIGIALRPHLLDQKQFRALTLSAERFVVWETILFEAKAVEKLTDSHIKQVLEYLAASRLRVGLLVNFGGDALEWKPVIL
jgi:GxxExxY protein